jgi:adenylate cyclase
LANGFAQPGRFAGEYRRRYGELPSQTLRRGRVATRRADIVDDEALRLTSRALPAAFAVAPGPCLSALDDAAAAQALAPAYGLPKAIAAWCLLQRSAQRFAGARGDDGEVACRLMQQACAMAPDDPLVLTLSAGAATLARRTREAEALVERALTIDPWAPWGWLRRGWLSAYFGDSQAALRELRYTLQLMPFEPIRHLILIAIGAAHFDAGRYPQAAAWVRDGVSAAPESFWAARILGAAAFHAGARDEARRIVRALRNRDPELTVAMARDAWPFPAGFNDRLGEGLEKSGLPVS